VAQDRSLTPMTDSQTLSEALKKHLKMSQISPARLRERERLKLVAACCVSVLIMTGVWFGFTRSQDTIIALNVPIEYINRPANYDILDTSVDEARLQLLGSSALIKSLGQGQVGVRVDLSKAAEGRNTFTITQDDIVLPPGVSLNKIQPTAIDVTLDVPATKELPIQADWTGRLPENVALMGVRVVPETVKVVGGSKTLEKVNSIYTAPLRLDSLTKSGFITTQNRPFTAIAQAGAILLRACNGALPPGREKYTGEEIGQLRVGNWELNLKVIWGCFIRQDGPPRSWAVCRGESWHDSKFIGVSLSQGGFIVYPVEPGSCMVVWDRPRRPDKSPRGNSPRFSSRRFLFAFVYPENCSGRILKTA